MNIRILFLASLTALSACASAEERARRDLWDRESMRLEGARTFADSVRRIDSITSAEVKAAEDAFPTVNYSRLHVADRHILDSIHKTFDYGDSKSPAYKAFVTLNRRVFGSVRVGDTVVVPDELVEDVRAYSVFPQRWHGADTVEKILVISNAQQSYACYEKGKLVRFAPCNTGTERKPTLPGRYAVNWKERLRISSINDQWKLPFNVNFHLYAGNAFHQFYMPGRPVSHSCVRQFMDDAEWLYNWVTLGKIGSTGRVIRLTGTPVLIVDVFDFNRPKYGPWLDLESNRDGKIELPDDPMGVEEALIPISQVPPSVRGALPDRDRYRYAEDTLRARGIIREGVTLSASIEYTRIRKEKEARRQREAAARAESIADPPQSTPE